MNEPKPNRHPAIKPLGLLFVMLLSAITSIAQTRTVRGTVKDDTGAPLIGASVVVAGKQTGTTTNVDGKFSLPVAPGAILEVSYIGYLTQRVEASRNGEMEIVLKSDQMDIEGVTVIGYGSVKKKDLTGAVTSISSKTLQESKSSSFLNSLQGRISGVQITMGSGAPGSASKVIVRGANSIAGTSDPLYVIDGIQMNGSDAPIASSGFGQSPSVSPLSSINPSDIVSIDVLKDASSTAIYGAKGANGVIIVTTRSGQEGAPIITYDGNVSISTRSKKIEMLSGNDWIDYRKDQTLLPDGSRIQYGYFQDWLFFENPGELDPAKMIPRDVYALPQYDWQDEMYRTAISNSHIISITGGTKDTKYAGSIGYTKEQGLLRNNDYTRVTGRLRLDHSHKRLNFSLNLNGSYSIYNGAANSGAGYNNMGVLQSAIVSRPLVFNNPHDLETQGGWKEPTRNLDYVYKQTTAPNFTASTTVSYQLLDGLYLSSTVSGTVAPSNCHEFYSKETPWGWYLKGRASISNSSWAGYDNINALNYSKDFKNDTRLNVMAAFQISGSKYVTSSIVKSNFADETTGVFDINKGVTLESATSNAGPQRSMSYLARVNYTVFDRYLFTASFRADGSDRFGENNRWGYFPSAAFAWRISDEPWLKDVRQIDNLKLRLSYGVTGNSNIPIFQYMAHMGDSFYGDDLGLRPTSMPNPDLKWETTTQYNVGLDLSCWNSAFNFTFDIYDKRTTNMLYEAIIPAQSGFKSQWQNLGEVDNRGIEIGINSRNISTKNFSWTTSFTVAANRNRVLEIGNGLDQAPIGAGTWSLSYIKINDVGRIMKGQPLGVIYGYQMDGVYQMDDFAGWIDKMGVYPANDPRIAWDQRDWQLKPETADCSPIGKPRPGTLKFKNTDGSEDNRITSNDQTILGNSQPKFFGGIGNNFTYKNFELGVYFTYSYGAKIFNSTKYELEGAYPGEYYNITRNFWNNHWSPSNPTNEYPSYADGNYYNSLSALPSSYYVEDGSYLRLQNLTFAYNLPTGFTKKLGLRNIRVYYSAYNLFTLTPYTGMDPEVDSGNALLSGFDTIGYPHSTTHTFGVTLSF